MEAKPDFYGILGADRNATAPEIKDAFQKRASAFHAAGKPKNIDDVEEIRRYATACRVLSDPEKRQYYERTGTHPLETSLAAETRFLSKRPLAEHEDNGWGDVAEVLVSIGLGLIDL